MDGDNDNELTRGNPAQSRKNKCVPRELSTARLSWYVAVGCRAQNDITLFMSNSYWAVIQGIHRVYRNTVESFCACSTSPVAARKQFLLCAFVLLGQSVQAEPVARCRGDTRMHAERLLRLFADDDDRIGIDDEVKSLKPIKNPADEGILDVEEVWGAIYKARYRMRIIYRHGSNECVLVGQEVFSDAEL